MNKKRWTKKEILFLKSNFNTLEYGEIATILKRSYNSVSSKTIRINLMCDKNKLKGKQYWKLRNHNHPNLIKTQFKKGIHSSSETQFKKGAHSSPETEFKEGKNHPNWKNGISFEEYPREFNNILKEQIRKRDNYCCQLCYRTKKENKNKNLDVHHIDYNKKNNNENNLISLCHKCHGKTNYTREKWLNYFRKGEIK